MSKGSRPRPYSVSQSVFGNNYDRIFGKNNMTPSMNKRKKVLAVAAVVPLAIVSDGMP